MPPMPPPEMMGRGSRLVPPPPAMPNRMTMPMAEPGDGAPGASSPNQVFASMAEQMLQLGLRMAQVQPSVSTKLSTILGQLTDVVQEVLQAPPEPEEGEEALAGGPTPGMPPVRPGPVLRSPALMPEGRPPGMPV